MPEKCSEEMQFTGTCQLDATAGATDNEGAPCTAEENDKGHGWQRKGSHGVLLSSVVASKAHVCGLFPAFLFEAANHTSSLLEGASMDAPTMALCHPDSLHYQAGFHRKHQLASPPRD